MKDAKDQLPEPEMTNDTPLADEDLDSISGGLNPQPLPPDKIPHY